jgi:hypothetical protein
VYLPVDAVESAFNVKLPRPWIVGPLQPPVATNTGKLWTMFVLAILAIAMLLGITRANRLLYRTTVTAPPLPPNATIGDRPSSAVFTPEFDLGRGQNVQLHASAPVYNSWTWVGGDLLNVNSGEIDNFELPVEYYAGVDSDGSWTEGSQEKFVYMSSPGKGRYALRFEVQWEKEGGPPVTIEVREGVFRWLHLLIALIVVTVPTIFTFLRARAFEVQRWKDSDYSPYAGSDSGDDDE